MRFIHNYDDVVAFREQRVAFAFGVAEFLDEGEDQALVLAQKGS